MTPEAGRLEAAAIRKTMWRIVPFLGLLYFVSFLDRVNIGYAALTMNQALGLTATDFGLGGGIFFIGYILLEVPSNLLLAKFGARFWIARIMISWGVVSTATAFVTGVDGFYALRFLLGIAEAGFFPGIILYLTTWFPAAHRGRIVGIYMIALPLSSVIGAPISTSLLDIEGLGLAGWQWLFVVEGVPAILLGIALPFVLKDSPAAATWLTPTERVWLENTLLRERETRRLVHMGQALADPRIWIFGAIYFGIVIGVYGLGFWLPQIVKSFGGLSNHQIGLLTGFPYLLAAGGMVLAGRRSDRRRERVLHTAIPCLIGAAGLCASAYFVGALAPSYAALTLGTIGVYAALPVFWSLPTAIVGGAAAAGGIALINALGNVSGFIGPFMIGAIKDRTGSFQYGILMLGGFVALAGMLTLMSSGSDRRSASP